MTSADRAFIQANIALATATILSAMMVNSELYRFVLAAAWLFLAAFYTVIYVRHPEDFAECMQRDWSCPCEGKSPSGGGGTRRHSPPPPNPS